LVRHARRLIASRVEGRYNVSDLAAEIQVSREHLCRVFRKETGHTPLFHLTMEKMRRACDLLRDTTMTGKEIAARLGYENPSHFTRTFRRVVGTTPRRYRRGEGIGLH
jgi:AraC-like DNA-binding protein